MENKLNIQEIEAKQVTLQAEMTTAIEAATVLTPATPEFDEAYSRYLGAKAAIAKIPDEIAAAKLSENKAAIDAAAITVTEGITQLLDGLKVADLLGKSVISLRYFRVVDKADDGTETVTTGSVFNPVTKVSTKGTGTKGAKAQGRTVIVDAEGNRLSCTKFVLAHATENEKTDGHADYIKYPHTAIDTRPKFDKFCESHKLTGYTYEVPQTGSTEAS